MNISPEKATDFLAAGLQPFVHAGSKRFAQLLTFRYDGAMKRHPNHRLLALMKRHKLEQADVCELCRCGRTSVYFWTRPPDHQNFQKMSSAYLRLLELELGEKSPWVELVAEQVP